MGDPHFVLELLVGTGIWLASVATVLLADRVAAAVRRGRTAHSPPPPPRIAPRRPPSWTLTLLVDVDEESSLVRPSVQLRGSPVPWGAWIRLELVDEVGAVRTSCGRRLPSWAIGVQLPLPQLALPEAVTVDEALRWHWDVVLDDLVGEKARWREHPAPAGSVNAEAELVLPGVTASPER